MKRRLTLQTDGEQITVVAWREGSKVIVERDEERYEVEVISESVVRPPAAERAAGSSDAAPVRPAAPAPARQAVQPAAPPAPGVAASSNAVRAPMVGVVKEVLVAAGDTVAVGQRVVIMEAMKMDIDVSAAVAGVVTAILANPGQNVVEGAPLVDIAGG